MGAVASGSGTGILTGGLLGGVASTIIDSAVKDVIFSATTDIQISERTHGKIMQRSRSVLNQGLSGQVVQIKRSNASWQRYRTRVLSTAEKVNLKFNQARVKLEDELSHAMAGFF